MLTPMLPYLTGILQMTPEPAWIFAVSLAPCKAEAQFGQLPSPRAARTVVGGLIWPFSLAFGRTPPSVALERMTIGGLTQALVVAVVVVPRSAAEARGTIPSAPRPRPSGR